MNEKPDRIKPAFNGRARIEWCEVTLRHQDGRTITIGSDGYIVGRATGHKELTLPIQKESQFDDLWDVLCELYIKRHI